MENQTHTLALRNMSVTKLRELGTEFLGLTAAEANENDKQNTILLLSEAASENSALALRLLSEGISIKPSFYLITLGSEEINVPSIEETIRLVEDATNSINSLLATRQTPHYKGFKLEHVERPNSQLFQMQFTWQKIYWYWEPENCALSYIYELQFGYYILDLDTRKAICTCHTLKEREYLTEIVKNAFGVSFAPMVLTKPLLDQIGTFDQVKRAGYTFEEGYGRPANVTYADESLANLPDVMQDENNTFSRRISSFYRIPLGSIEQQGLGVTSATGKLWIPRETSLDAVEDYGRHLLRRVTSTLNEMTERGEYNQVLDTFGLKSEEAFSEIKDRELRTDAIRLLYDLANMFLHGETERSFVTSSALVTKGVPSLFNYPRLQLRDPDTGEIAYWSDDEKVLQQIRVEAQDDDIRLKSYADGNYISLSNVEHPLTGARVEISSPLASLHLTPPPKLVAKLLSTMKHLSTQFPTLSGVVSLPFYISANVIYLDVRRAKGEANASNLPHTISLEDLRELRTVVSNSLSEEQRAETFPILSKLGEKCKHESDSNCRSCVSDKKYICLRSLVGHYLEEPLILAHKGIELSDIQGKVVVGPHENLKLYGFAKLSASKKDPLTARNKHGAILLAQVLSQIDKSGYDTVMIVSPSRIQEDLRERLELLCNIFNKKLLMLDEVVLSKMLLHFEEQAEFDNIDIKQLYRNSWNE